MSGLFANGFGGLSRLTNASKEGCGHVDRLGSPRRAGEQFAVRHARNAAFRHDHQEPRRAKVVRREEGVVSAQRLQFRRFGDQFGIGHRRPQSRAANSVVRSREFERELGRLEPASGQNLRRRRRSPSPKQRGPTNARQRDLADLQGCIGGTQGDGAGDQPTRTHRVIQFANPQRALGIRPGERPLDLPFAIAVEDRLAEHQSEYGDRKDDHTQGRPHPDRQPPPRSTSAHLPRSFARKAVWLVELHRLASGFKMPDVDDT